MPMIEADTRSPERRALDEAIAAEPHLPIPEFPADAPTYTIEDYLRIHRKPTAIAGVVENGLVRPLDSNVTLPEHARVIIVTAGS